LCGSESGQRVSQLKELDALLKDYESEYHYLFKLVQSNADDNAGADLAHYYHMPNVARRLLEAFLSFRFPSNTDGLNEKIKSASTDSAKTNRIVRFLHVNSHEEHQISPHEHDGTVLAEAPQILSDIINLIKEEDPRHYAEMRKLVPSQNTQSETQVEAA